MNRYDTKTVLAAANFLQRELKVMGRYFAECDTPNSPEVLRMRKKANSAHKLMLKLRAMVLEESP